MPGGQGESSNPDRGINLHLKHGVLCNSGLGHSGCDAICTIVHQVLLEVLFFFPH